MLFSIPSPLACMTPVCSAHQLILDPLHVRLAQLQSEQLSDTPDPATNPSLEGITSETDTTHSVR